MPLSRDKKGFIPLEDILSDFTNMEWNELQTFGERSTTNTSSHDLEVRVNFTVQSSWPPRRRPNTPCPSLNESTSPEETLVEVNDNDAASFKTVTTIDGMFDDNAPSHPCMINPTRVSGSLITYPAPTYQPYGTSPPIPPLPDNADIQDPIRSQWLRRELEERERQVGQDLERLERATAYKSNRLRIRIVIMIVVFASLVALIVTSNIYRNDAHPKLHSILVAFGTAFVGLFIISMVNVFIEMARRSGMPGY